MITTMGLLALMAPSYGNQELADNTRKIDEMAERKLLHGFRLGYTFVSDIDGKLDERSSKDTTLAERYDIRSPHMFLIGYEVTWRMVGNDWLNVLLVGNLTVTGLEQSKFFPGINGIIGFEFVNSFQAGVGISVMPSRDEPAHMLFAAGWTPQVGTFYVPVHAFFVPDVNGHHRTGVTVGVNW